MLRLVGSGRWEAEFRSPATGMPMIVATRNGSHKLELLLKVKLQEDEPRYTMATGDGTNLGTLEMPRI